MFLKWHFKTPDLQILSANHFTRYVSFKEVRLGIGISMSYSICINMRIAFSQIQMYYYKNHILKYFTNRAMA